MFEMFEMFEEGRSKDIDSTDGPRGCTTEGGTCVWLHNSVSWIDGNTRLLSAVQLRTSGLNAQTDLAIGLPGPAAAEASGG